MVHQSLQTTLDVTAVRRDFPLLQRTMHDRPLVYLDSAATSQKPQAVLDVLQAYYLAHNANVHRGVYELAEEATEAYETARADVARFIGVTPQETIFVRNATEAINLVARTFGRQHVHEGDRIVLTPLEHHSNLIPWQMLAAETGARLEFADLTPDGAIDIGSVERLLAAGNVRLVAFAHISNVLGTVAPVRAIADLAHGAGAAVLLDAAQSVPHVPVDARSLDVDFLALTGHKMLGPMGIGVLYGRRSLLENMPPFLGGGEMIRRVGLRESTWNDLPWKFEAGTPSVGDAVALGGAVRYLEGIGMEVIAEHDLRLARYTLDCLRTIPDLQIYGPEERGALVAFTMAGIHPHDLASLLDERGIAVRAGHHCTQPLHDLLGIPATTRASFYLYNDERDVDALVEGIQAARQVLA